jgi:hypothetical protein
MRGRKNYDQAEIDNARTAIDAQLAAYKKLLAGPGATDLDEFEPLFFNNLAVALDRLYVHRFRAVTGKDTGKDTSPLNELELIVDSLTNNGGIFRGSTAVNYVPADSITGLEFCDRVALT